MVYSFREDEEMPEKWELMKLERLREVALSEEADKRWEMHQQQQTEEPLPYTMLGLHLNPDKSPNITVGRDQERRCDYSCTVLHFNAS